MDLPSSLPPHVQTRPPWRWAVIGAVLTLIGLGGPVMLFFVSTATHRYPGPAVQTQQEINELATAIENFKSRFRVDYLPSRIRLAELYSEYALSENGAPNDDELDRDSVNYLSRLWPQILSVAPVGHCLWKKVGINWNGNVDEKGMDIIDKGKVTLEGDQCLVFFLSGIPDRGPPANALGWATNLRDPAMLAQRKGRTNPFFEFSSNRLFLRSGDKGGSAAGYFSFADPFRTWQPFAYFSNYGQRDGYGRYGDSDCATLGVSPYFQTSKPRRYCNPAGTQILSAGPDGTFGAGGLWQQDAADQVPDAGNDDMSNFNNGAPLGRTADSLERSAILTWDWLVRLVLMGAVVTSLLGMHFLERASRVVEKCSQEDPNFGPSWQPWVATLALFKLIGLLAIVLVVILSCQSILL
jgi:hypothetical protein